MALSPTQVAAYRRDGFVAPIDVLSPHEALILRERFEEAERRYPERLNSTHRNNAHYEFLCLDEVVHDARILDAVESLVGPDILLWSTVLFIKAPNSPAHVSFHQDATYMGLSPQIGLTAWLALSDTTVESGCMLMEPGSHHHSIRPHRDTFGEDNILTRGQTISGIDENVLVPVELGAGQMSLHHVRTVHGSAPNTSHDRRIGLALQGLFPPSVVQTRGQDLALLLRGTDEYGHFDPGKRPAQDAEPAAADFRDRANHRLGELLYAGARRQRTL